MMMKAGKTFLNMLFLVFSGAGFIFIFYGERFVPAAALLLPAGLVLVYALFVSLMLQGCGDRSFADHQVDSIYFLGFLYTLLSLITLFYRLYDGGSVSIEDEFARKTFLYAGISVTTSLAGVLFRNMARGNYLKHHPDSTDELERTYQVLRGMAENFTDSYRETLESIKMFLAEREENSKDLSRQEKRYQKSLEAFTDTADRMTRTLSEAEGAMSGGLEDFSGVLRDYTRGVKEFNSLSAGFSEALGRMRKDAQGAPFSAVTEELGRFGTGTRELNGVLDSLIDVLEVKVEKVR